MRIEKEIRIREEYKGKRLFIWISNNEPSEKQLKAIKAMRSEFVKLEDVLIPEELSRDFAILRDLKNPPNNVSSARYLASRIAKRLHVLDKDADDILVHFNIGSQLFQCILFYELVKFKIKIAFEQGNKFAILTIQDLR